MSLNFDFNQLRSIEFGVEIDNEENQRFSCISVESNIQDVLKEMAETTWNEMLEDNPEPSRYEPSEKYKSLEHFVLPLSDDLAKRLRQIHEAHNFPLDNNILSKLNSISCYFVRMTDQQERKLF